MEQSYKEKYEQAIERLKQWDREHPCAGYVLSDRDKFIFPELAESESEDEKIRKRLITDFGTIGKKEWGGLEVKDILSWLERQGEHANFRNKIQVGDKVTRNEDGVLVNLSQLNRVAKKNEKQGEQKPVIEIKTAAESLGISSDEYNKIVDECLFGEQKLTEFERGLFDMLTDISKPRTADCVKSHSEKLLSIARKMIALEQKPAEWSEEDEQHIDSLLKRLDALCRNKFERTRFAISEDREWLKSLKDRVQPKQEWSEEDEKIINGLIDSLTRISLNTRTDSTSPNYSFYREIDWLKSLRPQPQWKPSEDDIIILEKLIKGELEPKVFQATLQGILEQLKKLKEG